MLQIHLADRVKLNLHSVTVKIRSRISASSRVSRNCLREKEIGPIKYICLKECRCFCAEHSFSTWSLDWLYCSEIRSTIMPGQVRAVSNQRLYVICSIHCSVCQLMKARNIAFHWIFRNSSKLYQLSKICFFHTYDIWPIRPTQHPILLLRGSQCWHLPKKISAVPRQAFSYKYITKWRREEKQ